MKRNFVLSWKLAVMMACGITALMELGSRVQANGSGGPCVCESLADETDCGSGCAACDCPRLLGVIAPSDWCFQDFISPMTNPVYFEDPRTLTEARFIYIHHKTPSLAPGLTSDAIQLFALQLRAALTERLSVIATKDGFITSESPLLNDGWADVNAGLKYNLYRDVERQQLLSAGLTFEMPTGSTRTLQGNGDGMFHLFLTGGAQVGDDAHIVSAAGFWLPTDTAAENQVWYWSNHIDRKFIWDDFYVLGEMNWYHWMKSGSAFPLAVEGGDLFNLGSVNVAGNDIVTGAMGIKYAPQHRMELGLCYEVPLTERRGVIDNRLTFDAIIRY